MIPIELRLSNFLSYGDSVEPLDFSSFTMACLTGRNGHGKSALLDAITWAIWGEARKAGYSRTPDADLLRLNADEMAVEFTFQLDEREFQVLRTYRRGGRSGKVEFRARTVPDEGFRLLSGASKKETQKRIVETIGLDYKTFVNSSFLQQGKADSFTRQSPQERKEILGNILGLDYYDRLLEEAKQRWSACRAKLRSLDDAIAALEQEIDREEETRNHVETLHASQQAIEKTVADVQAEEQRLTQRVHELQAVHERLERLERETREWQRAEAEHIEREKKLTQEQNELNALLGRTEEITRNQKRYEELNEELNQLLEVENRYSQMEEELRSLERRIEKERSRIAERAAALSTSAQRLPKLIEAIEAIHKQLANQAGLEIKHAELEAQIESLSTDGQSLNAAIEMDQAALQKMQESVELTEEKLDLLRKGETQTCPLCSQSLDAMGRDELESHLLQEAHAARAKIEQLEKSIHANKKRRDSLRADYRKRDKERKQIHEQLAQLSALRKTLEEREKDRQDAEIAQGEWKTLSNQLQSNAFAAEERKTLTALANQLIPLQNQLKRRKALQEELYRLRNAPSEWHRWQSAQRRLPELERDLESLRRRSREIAEKLHDAQTQRRDALPQLESLRTVDAQRAQIVQKRVQIENERSELYQRLGAARERLETIQRRKREREVKRNERIEVSRDLKLYEILKGMFSRDGIPAMIVEQALPELEMDANRLLQRLTNGACSLALESQREKKSGGVVETLDIKISDEMGTRDYELYSGGEAFRTDLALRIALSQLLCRRAGSRLQLLVIDEGFGTQDAEGISRIVEAIDDIQDEFEKILVVTHLEELKEKFLVRIEVMKEPGLGSLFHVIHSQ